MFFEKKVKNLDIWDIGLTKLSVATFVLFILTIWPTAMNWVQSINPWIFFIIFVVLAIRPIYRMFKRR